MKATIVLLAILMSSCTQVPEESMYSLNTDQLAIDTLTENFRCGDIEVVENPEPLTNGSPYFYSVEVTDPWCIVEWEICTVDFCVLNRYWEPTEVTGIENMIEVVRHLYDKTNVQGSQEQLQNLQVR